MSADEELTAALTHFTAERLGLTLLYLAQTVARTHPDLLRRALGEVFDLTLYEEEARKAAANLGRLHAEALALRQELRELRQQAAELERYRAGPHQREEVMKPDRVGMSVAEAVAKALADGTATEGKLVSLDAARDAARAAGGELEFDRVSEGEFQRQVIDLAHARGWKVAHFRAVRVARPDGSVYYQTPVQADGAGWPDLVLVRAGVVMFVELKVGKNPATAEQIAWLDALRETGAAAGVWRPGDWSKIREVLE